MHSSPLFKDMMNEIIRADCSIKKNRILLIKKVMKILKTEDKPSIEKLQKASLKIGDKYRMPARIFDVDGNISLVISVEGGYSIISCKGKYEAYCKHILYVKEYKKLYEN